MLEFCQNVAKFYQIFAKFAEVCKILANFIKFWQILAIFAKFVKFWQILVVQRSAGELPSSGVT